MIEPKLSVGNLDAERDFLDVDDVIDAYMAALAFADEAKGFAIFNIASSRLRSIASILDRMIGLTPAKLSVERAAGRMRASDIAATRCDTSAFTARTGWRPQRDFDDTIAAILDWWRSRV